MGKLTLKTENFMLTNQQKQILSFFLRHPEYAYPLIMKKFRFSNAQLKKFDKVIDWKLISGNDSIVMDFDFLEKYREKLNWHMVSGVSRIPWTEEMLDKFRDHLNWSTKIPGPGGEIFQWSFSSNGAVRWTIPGIEKYRQFIDWEDFNNNCGYFWTEETIEKYDRSLLWKKFSPNPIMPYSREFIEKHIAKTGKPYHKLGIFCYPELIKKYADDLDWSILSYSVQPPWSRKFIEKWFNRLDKTKLALNSSAVSDLDTFEYLRRNLDSYSKFLYFSCNMGSFWTEELIDKYSDNWNWIRLSSNISLPWSKKFFEKYIDKWHFGKYDYISKISSNEDDYFEPGLSCNWNTGWTIELIEKYEERWDIETVFDNEAVWHYAFEKEVNEELINLFLEIQY